MPLPRRLLATALPLAALVACTSSDSAIQDVTGITGPANPSLSTIASQAVTFYGPKRFVRETGAPRRVTETISTAGFTGPFTVQVTSGDAAGSNRVSSATVAIDGEPLMGPADFSQARSAWTFTRSLGGTVALDVEIASVPGSYLEISIAGTPAGVRFCPGDAGAHQSMSDAVAAAVAAAGANGTVLVCSGTHVVPETEIGRGVTIRSEQPGGATLASEPSGVVLLANAIPAGESVRVVDLGFRLSGADGAIGVFTYDPAGRVHVDSSRFDVVDGPAYSIYSQATSHATQSRVTVRASSFRGGAVGIFTHGEIPMTVSGNSFSDLSFSSIQRQGLLAGRRSVADSIVGNTLVRCGGTSCIRAIQAGDVLIEDNSVSNAVGLLANTGITVERAAGVVDPGPIAVRNNRILGTGLGADRAANASYAFRNTGIHFRDFTATPGSIIEGNTVTSAFNGMTLLLGDATVTNNRISGTSFNLTMGGPNPAPIVIQRNDFLDYQQAHRGPAALSRSLACNYWGSTYAPAMQGHVPGEAYSPWATAPIAGTSNPCDPSTMPALVKLCATPDGATPMVRGMEDGVKVTGSAGHLVVCNGTYPVGSVALGGRSITIRAESALGATLDGALGFATPHATNFWINNAGSGAVTLRGFVFRNAVYNNVSVHGTYGSLLIEGSEFHPTTSMNYGDPLVGGSNSIGYRAGVGVYSATGGGVTVRNSRFVGGDIGFNSANAGNLRVESNTFTNQNNAAVHIGGSPTGYAGDAEIIGNTVDGCSSYWCIGVFGSSRVDILQNTLRTTAARRTGTAITVRATTAIVNDNIISGASVGGDRSAQSSYDVRFGISFYQTAAGTALRNRVSRAYGGIWVDQSSATASDNIVTTTWAPVGAWGPPSTSASLVANRNDFTDWVVALHGDYVMPNPNARCNWWGSSAGVSAAQAPGFGSGVYTPWAMAPIAGTGTACTP